jgi:hypothetical protein
VKVLRWLGIAQADIRPSRLRRQSDERNEEWLARYRAFRQESAEDVVASIRRFAARISFANALMAATEELSAPDDRTVRFRLKRPFPHLPEALAGPGVARGFFLLEAVSSPWPVDRRAKRIPLWRWGKPGWHSAAVFE